MYHPARRVRDPHLVPSRWHVHRGQKRTALRGVYFTRDAGFEGQGAQRAVVGGGVNLGGRMLVASDTVVVESG